MFPNVISTCNQHKNFKRFYILLCLYQVYDTAQLRSDQAHVKYSRGTSGYYTRQCRAMQCFPIIHKSTAHEIDATKPS